MLQLAPPSLPLFQNSNRRIQVPFLCSSGRGMAKAMMLPSLFCTFFIGLVLLSFSPAAAQEVEDEREFSYDQSADNGPDRWWRIHPDWAACGNGTLQSPIDLEDERVEVVPHLGRLKRKYRAANATLKNRGHDIMVEWEGEDEGPGYIKINGTEYPLKQCHWHAPSEHTLHRKRFAMELHMVHQNSNGDVAVIGILYKIGRPDSFLQELMHDLEVVAGKEDAETSLGLVNPKRIEFGSRKYYRYLGSLTTPPCTEGVVWTIVEKIRTVSREQVRMLHEAVHDNADGNARPLQALNDRDLHFYRPAHFEKKGHP